MYRGSRVHLQIMRHEATVAVHVHPLAHLIADTEKMILLGGRGDQHNLCVLKHKGECLDCVCFILKIVAKVCLVDVLN